MLNWTGLDAYHEIQKQAFKLKFVEIGAQWIIQIFAGQLFINIKKLPIKAIFADKEARQKKLAFLAEKSAKALAPSPIC